MATDSCATGVFARAEVRTWLASRLLQAGCRGSLASELSCILA